MQWNSSENEATQSCLTLCDPMDYQVPQVPLSRNLGFSSKNTGVDCHLLLQEIFPTQGLNPGFSHCRQSFTIGATRKVQWNSSRTVQNPKGWCHQGVNIQYVSKSGRPSSGHGTGRGQSSSQFPRKVVLKNIQTIGQLHSSPMLIRSCLKSCMLGFSIMQTKNFQMFKLDLEKEVEPEIKLPTFTGSLRKQGNSKKTSSSVSSTMPKPLTVWIITNCGKFLKRWEYQTMLPVSREICMQVEM